MDKAKINELRQERAGLVAEARKVIEAAEAEKRAMTAEERQSYEKIETDIEDLGVRIKDLDAQRELELELADVAERGFDPREQRGDPNLEEAEARASEYREAFDKYIRHGISEVTPEQRKLLQQGFDHKGAGETFRSDQLKGTTTLGGFTVPTSFNNKLVEHQVQSGAIRNTRVYKLQTESGEDLQVPKTTAHGTAQWIAEGNAITPDNETFGQVTLKSYVVAEIVRVSIQLLQDTGVDLEGYLARALGGNIGRKENTAFVVGTGSTQPTGITTFSSTGVTAASATAIAADELLDLFYSVGPQYRRDAQWLMADSTIKAVRKLKDSTGQYIWQPGLVAGEQDTLLGKQVFDDPDVPAIGSGNKSIVFGDLSAYWVRDTGSFVLKRLDERYADNLLVGFLAYHRTDGNLIDQTGAIKYLVHP